MGFHELIHGNPRFSGLVPICRLRPRQLVMTPKATSGSTEVQRGGDWHGSYAEALLAGRQQG